MTTLVRYILMYCAVLRYFETKYVKILRGFRFTLHWYKYGHAFKLCEE